MFWTALLPVLALPSALAALPGYTTGQVAEVKTEYVAKDATMYAYGPKVPGTPIVYGSDGMLYINPKNCTTLSAQAIKWDIPTLATAANSSTVAKLGDGSSPGNMGVRHGAGLYDFVRVLSKEESATDPNVSDTGITLYGKQVVFYNGDTYNSMFWAQPVGEYWVLAWNSDQKANSSTFPVVVKTIPSSKAATKVT